MAPPAQTLDGGDGGWGFGGPTAADFASVEQKNTSTDIEFETLLQDASSAPLASTPAGSASSNATGEERDWSTSASMVLDHPVGQSDLPAPIVQLDLSLLPSTPEDMFTESSSRRSSLDGWLGDAAEELHQQAVQSTVANDAMDISDVSVQSSDSEDHITHVVASSTNLLSSFRPSRSNPNSNHDMCIFLSSWRTRYVNGTVESPINAAALRLREELMRPPAVTRADVRTGGVDEQGIPWVRLGTSKSEAQVARDDYHHHPLIRPFPAPFSASQLPNTERFFRFQRTNTEHRAWIEHYQLRNLVTSTSHNDVHYVSRSRILSTNASGAGPYCVMDLNNPSAPSNASADFRITALASSDTMLVAGGFHGEYALQDLTAEYGAEPTTGFLSNAGSRFTNHIHSFHSRSAGYSQAMFCSNDGCTRTLDCYTNRLVTNISYSDNMNCAATSPNGRLRVLVGDFEGSIIVDADRGTVLEHPTGSSRGEGFACAWADDDIHVATAGQDCQVLVWDARNWSTPLASIACVSTYATSIQFSPIGGGSPILIVGEAADTISIINAQTYASKQSLDHFGDFAGATISDDGSQLVIANGDRYLGGMIMYQRQDFGEVGIGRRERRNADSEKSDWLPESEVEFHPRVRLDTKARRRRGLHMYDDTYL